MKSLFAVLQRLREVAIRLANTKWDTEDCVREMAAHRKEWVETRMSKNILDMLVIDTIKAVLADGPDGAESSSAGASLEQAIYDFKLSKVAGDQCDELWGCGCAKDDPLAGVEFADALDQRLDRFLSYADVPFPGKKLKD